ncbi:mannosyl-oligosaccharide alpha-1,2-mannosidase [Dispira parvispora]|uniref:alpha-1,2-Mannosidase n=1 Tax=Dispira parvispora TaxID=1520584 RepID=A0A9W8AZV1_9FUNG|nr:mannosyl-oligosaccharide alpha-1,2-mannosidase [Dispira parvispora]
MGDRVNQATGFRNRGNDAVDSHTTAPSEGYLLQTISPRNSPDDERIRVTDAFTTQNMPRLDRPWTSWPVILGVGLLVLFLLVHHNGNQSAWSEGQGLKYPLGTLNPFPPTSDEVWTNRRSQVVEAFRYAWQGYRRDAYGADEYHPISQRGSNLTNRGIGYTIVDSLDTILIMGLDKEYQEARDWVVQHLDFDVVGSPVSVFETTIRILGGLLSAYHWSHQDVLYLTKAIDLADRLLSAWLDEENYPIRYGFLARSPPGTNQSKWEAEKIAQMRNLSISVAEVGTLQMEFAYLSHLSKDPKYHQTGQDVMHSLRAIPKLDGLIPLFIDRKGNLTNHLLFGVGAHGDSYYEYLLKQWIQTRGHPDQQVYRDMYDASVEGVKRHLIRRSNAAQLAVVGTASVAASSQATWEDYVASREWEDQFPLNFDPSMEHLSCFYPGLLALGATRGYTLADIEARRTPHQFSARDIEDLDLAEKLAYTCWQTYHHQPTVLAAEITDFHVPLDATSPYTPGSFFTGQFFSNAPRTKWVSPKAGFNEPPRSLIYGDFNYLSHRHNILRPETVESFFILWRITKNPQYREWGWQVFQAFEKYAKYDQGGYTSLADVTKLSPPREDKMETFFLAETLKYLYLLFSPDDVVPLTEYVFNTEAHPFPILDQLNIK